MENPDFQEFDAHRDCYERSATATLLGADFAPAATPKGRYLLRTNLPEDAVWENGRYCSGTGA